MKSDGCRFRFRFTMRSLLFVVVAVSVFLSACIATQNFGLEAVNNLERDEFGEPYMTIRTDPPRSFLPFIVTTGLTTTIHDATSGSTYRETVSRRYYLWFGRTVRIGEWKRARSC